MLATTQVLIVAASNLCCNLNIVTRKFLLLQIV